MQIDFHCTIVEKDISTHNITEASDFGSFEHCILFVLIHAARGIQYGMLSWENFSSFLVIC